MEILVGGVTKRPEGQTGAVRLAPAARGGRRGARCPPFAAPLFRGASGWARLACLVVPVLLAAAAHAREDDAMATGLLFPLDPVVELEPLLSADTGDWMRALEELRSRPEQSRQLLLAVVEDDLALKRRWRIFHHLLEFGRTEDIPTLLKRLPTVIDVREKAALRGAARGLYWATGSGVKLRFAVEDFSFLQTSDPFSLNGEQAGKLTLSAEAFRTLHGENVPVAVIRKLLPLRNQVFATEAQLEAVFSRALGKKIWKKHQQVLRAAVEEISKQLVQEGTLRVAFRNRLDRPLLLEVGFDAWFGRFDPQPEPVLIFLEAGSSASADLPVRIVKADPGPPVRVDMRLLEVHGARLPAYQKLYIGR